MTRPRLTPAELTARQMARLRAALLREVAAREAERLARACAEQKGRAS